MKLISKAALLACSALALTACGGDGDDILNISAPSARLVNADADAPALVLYRNSDAQTDAGTPTYEQASKYFETVSATSTWSVRDATTGQQIGSTSVAASGSTRYTLIAFPGVDTPEDLVQISDPFDVGVTSDNARVRIANGTPFTGAFDVYILAPGASLATSTPTMSAVDYKAVSPASGANSYSFPGGTYTISLALPGTKTAFFAGTLTAGKDDDLLLITLEDADDVSGVKILDIPSKSGTNNSEILNGQ